MKHLAIAVTLLLAANTAGAHAEICLRTSEISSSNSPDGKVLLLRMRDGKTWRAQLRPECPALRFSGFSWIVRGGQVCEGSQILKVIESGQICAIGSLSPENSGSESSISH